MRTIRTVLFDAGGVLLDVDYARLQEHAAKAGAETTIEALSSAEAQARTEVHRRVTEGESVAGMWREYFHYIFDRVDVPKHLQSEIIDELWATHQAVGLWTHPIDGSIDAVRELKARGYRLGVVSNAEGRVEHDLGRAGYEGLFETVVDSHVVGVAKPDPRIFAIALERMEAEAASTLFIGDVPAVDVAGAEAAGCLPVLLDRHDLYPDAAALRLSSVAGLLELLPG